MFSENRCPLFGIMLTGSAGRQVDRTTGAEYNRSIAHGRADSGRAHVA